MKYSNHTYYPTALSKVLILLAMFVALPVHAAQKIFQSSTESTVFLSYKTLAEANSGSTIDNRGALDENGYFTYTATSNRDLKTSSSYEISLTDYSGKAYTTLGAYDWKNPHAIGFKIAPYKKYIIRAYFVASKDRGLCIRKGYTYSSSVASVASTTSDGKSSYYTLNYENTTGDATETFWVSGIDGNTVYLCAIEVVILDFYFENSPVSADLLTAGTGVSPSKNNYNFHNVDVLSDKSMTWTFPVMGSHIGIDSNEDISYNFTSGQTITNCVKLTKGSDLSDTSSYIHFYWPFGEADVFVFCRLADDASADYFKAISFQHRDGTGSQTYWIGKSNADPVVFHISKSGDHYLYVSNTNYDFYIYFIGISKSAHFGSGIKDESGASLAYNDVVTMKVGQEKTFTITTTEETLPYNLGMYNWGSSYSYLTMRNPNTNQFTINAHTETTDDETITLLYYSIGGVTKTDSYISGTGEKIQFPLKLRVLPVPVLNVNGNPKDEIEDATLPSVVSVFATTEGGSLSFTLSDATITYSSQQSLVAADPSSLSFSDAAPTVAIPDANTGLTYYYYIKAEKNSQTSYYCLKAYNTIGTDNGIKPIDRAIEFGGSNTPFTDVTTLYKSPSLVSGNPFMYVYASEDRQVQVRADDKKDIVMARAGQFANDGTPLNGVLEIRVSGAGTLKVKGYNNNGRVTDEIKVVKKGTSSNTPLGAFAVPYDGYYPMVYATEEPATFYIYGSSTSTYITGLKWEPLNTKAIPEITWSGSNTMTVGDVSDHIATAPSGLTIEYKVIKGITGLPEGTILTVTDGHLNFTPAAAGTLVIAAATEETTSYQAFSKTKAITVEKKDAVLSLGSALTGIYTVVGGKSRTTSTNTVAITAENIDWAISGVAGVTKADGDFSFSTDGVYGQLDGDGYLLGKALGNVTLTVIWTPRTDAAKTKLNEVKKTFTIEVKPGTLRLSFAYSTSTVSTDKSIMPYIIAQNESGEIVRGLKMLYTVTGVYATADAGQTYITAGSVEGSVTVTGNYVGASLSRAADTEPYYSASTSDNTDGDVIKTMTLYVQKPSTTGRLTLIPQTSDYQSDNMASLFWSNETNTSSADISLASPKFVMNSNYISSDNRFRLYASNNEELVDNEYIRGLKISEQDSYLSFFAQGSATLVLHGYASIARTIEIYAVNSQDYTGNATTDASLANASLVTSVKVDAGTFIKNVPMTLAGNNYYFVKTMNGGLYLSSIEWKSSLAIPTLTVTPSEITLDQEHHVVSLKNNFTTQAYLTQSETQYWIYDNSALKQASGNTESVTFTYSSLNDAVATVNSLTGVITPIRNGTVTMYITLEAGSVSDGDGGTKSYGSVRYPVSVNIPVGLQVVDEYFEKDEIVYSTVSSTNAVWQTPIIKKHGTDEDIVPDHIYYYLQDFEGNTISSEYAVIYNTDAQDSGGNSLTQATGSYSAGQVEIKSACPDNYQFRVIARLCGMTIVDQQAYYIVTVTKALTLPTISCSGAGIKELNVAPTLSSSYTSHDRREYYARANKQKETVKRSERNNVVSEEDVTMTITIPSSTPGLTLKAEVVSDFTTPPTTTLTEADGKYTLQISNPNSYTTKYVWVRIEDSSTGGWNGFYKITFFSAPNCQVSDYLDPAITPKTATFTTRNSDNPGTIYYTFDSSTPTAESHRYTDPIERTANTVYNVVEAYSPTGGFVNGTNNFTTNVMYNIELEITDPLVFEVVKGTEIHPNVSFAKTINDAEGSRQLRVMFGSDQVCVYKNSAFTTIGLKWEKGIDADTGIPSYVDIYSQYCSASMSSGTEQPNPYTEYNGGFGGSGSGLGTNVPAPYITPVSGAFFRFEPEYNGVVTVWIRQNGASGSSAYPNSDKESRYYLTRRPVFIMDETGTLIQRNTAPYSAEWDFDGTVNPATGIEDKSKAYRYINGSIADVSQQSTLDRDFMWGWNHLNSITTDTQWKTSWYAMDFYNKKYRFGKTMPKMDKSGTLDMFDYTNDYRSIPIVDIVYCDNEATDLDGQSFVLYGYELPMPNYVRYRIPVKAGKSYYMGGRGTRNAFCAVKFDNDHTTDHITTYQLQDKGTNDWTESINDGTQINVTLDRVFTAGKWSPIVLPFSVSESRLRDMFGDNTLVLTLDQYYKYNSGFEMPAAVKVGRNGVSADLMFTHHRYQMLYANTPAYICPTFNWKNVTTCPARTQDELDALSESVTQDANGIDCKNGVTFNRVTFVAGGVKTVDIGEGYEVTGSYAVTIGSENGEMYYLENVYSGTSWTATMYHSTEGVNMKAGRCWIHKKSGVNHAPPLTNIGMNTFDGTEIITESMSSGIVDVFADAVAMDSWQYNPNVYNLQGMTVGKVNENISIDDILNQLNSGIYIYQGKKYYVK